MMRYAVHECLLLLRLLHQIKGTEPTALWMFVLVGSRRKVHLIHICCGPLFMQECTSLMATHAKNHVVVRKAVLHLVAEPADPVHSLGLFRTDGKHLKAAPARVMSNNGDVDIRQTMVVLSTDDQWSSLVSLLKESAVVDKELTTRGSQQVYFDLVLEKRLVSLNRADILGDATEEEVSRAVNGCFEACKDAISAFLLLIQGGNYTSRQMRLVELLQVHFGAEAFKYLLVVSLEDGKTADTLDDALLELIDACDGRYCRLTTSAARDKMNALVSMVDYTLAESGGYGRAALDEAKRRSTEDTAMSILSQKVREAEERLQAFGRMAAQSEERRAKEAEEMRAKHVEERRKEAVERKRYEIKKESLEEAVISHRATLHLHIKPHVHDDDANNLSVVLLGLSGSGKTSALSLISARAGNRYRDSESHAENPRPTLSCTRREVCAAGRRLVLVDTPELWDEDGVENPEKVKDCLALALPGPHVYLLVLQVGRFTWGESQMLAHLQKAFGKDAAERTVLLFVRMDSGPERPQRVHDYMAGAHAALRQLVRRCGSRYYELSLAAPPRDGLTYPQVRELLAGIYKLAASHGGRGHSVKRFSVRELQDRKKAMEDSKDAALEDNFLLIEN
ncbi:uncharacterized protein LOC133487455 [Phyllopteryx taeniolatus]|uniref:uncharacterized protein LOC133487455 n=1 Tax=Phyllopteryx taeniolatus TaxID=161469 RepID=UPI002AD463B9|nr:uncharacterized protein LOC133487455 [Phyllopteryx taeniolatus]